MQARLPEPRRTVIEGRSVIVIERNPPIPPTLGLLLDGGRDDSGRPWAAMRVLTRAPLRVGGATSDCLREDHRFADWLGGFHVGSDGVTRQLRLLACQDCGGVSVRDVSADVLPGMATSQAPKHKDHQLGWYSGARPGQRQYT